MLFKVGAYLVVLLTFGAGLWWVKSQLDLLQTTQARLVQVEGMLNQSRNELTACLLARKIDQRENTDSYQKADWACQETVKQAVAGTRVIRVPVEEYVYVDRQISTPQSCPATKLPDFFRMSDIHKAGTDPD